MKKNIVEIKTKQKKNKTKKIKTKKGNFETKVKQKLLRDQKQSKTIY